MKLVTCISPEVDPWYTPMQMRLKSTLSKSDTFGAGTKCPSKRDVRLIYRGSNKGSEERQGPTLGVRFTEVSVL